MGIALRLTGQCCFTGVLEMATVITREIIEIVAAMQAKALAFDSEHPNHVLGPRTAAEYGAAIRVLVSEQEQLQVGELMLAAGAQAMRLLVLSCTNTRCAN
jgi:small-conductance mechanosensitive channel